MFILRRGLQLFLLVFPVLIVFSGTAKSGQTPQNSTPAAQKQLLDKYCVTCHNDRLRTGGLTLDSIDFDKVAGNAEVWEKVLHKLRTGQMPPLGAPRPDPPMVAGVTSLLETALDREAAMNPNP